MNAHIFFIERKPVKINFFFGIRDKNIYQSGVRKTVKAKVDYIRESSDSLFKFENSISRIGAEYELARKREIFLDETSSKNSCKT